MHAMDSKKTQHNMGQQKQYHVHSIAAQVAKQAGEQPCWPQQKLAPRHLPVSLVQLRLSGDLSVGHMRSSGEVRRVA